MKRIIVVGGGIVGLASAWKLALHYPKARVLVLEKEAGVGLHQSGNNSGVLHAGIYYTPGSAKARLAVAGIQEMVAFCQKKGIPHEICGKLIVATNAQEKSRLDHLRQRGIENGLTGLKILSRAEMIDREPNVGGLNALYVPQEGIVDYLKVCEALQKEIQSCGGEVKTNSKVVALISRSGGWLAKTDTAEFEGDFLVNCGGLYCDRLSVLAGEKRDVRIVPFRGEYYKIKTEREFLVRHLIYPVPDPQFPFLGVHFTRLIRGGIEAGPNAVLAFAREGYRMKNINAFDLFDALTFKGLWRFLARHYRLSLAELKQSLSKNAFCRALQKLVPAIQPQDLDPGGAGVRAQAMSPAGDLVQDFYFLKRRNALHVLNAPSPAATASLAIGTEIANVVASSGKFP